MKEGPRGPRASLFPPFSFHVLCSRRDAGGVRRGARWRQVVTLAEMSPTSKWSRPHKCRSPLRSSSRGDTTPRRSGLEPLPKPLLSTPRPSAMPELHLGVTG